MSRNPAEEALLGEMKLRELSRRTKLMERARGRKIFSWTEYTFLFFIAMFFYFAFLNRAHISQGDMEMFMIVIFLQVLHTTLQQKRLQALVELLDLQGKEEGSPK